MPSPFSALGIRSELIDYMKESGVTVPTPVQEKSIPPLLAGQDVIAQAQTGTGKTLAFALPIMERIDSQKPYVQALIITPTRELALQITSEMRKLASVIGVNVLAAYGGQDVESQVKKLKGAIHIVVGTPGRLMDHLKRGTVSLNGLSMLVLDEADQMLNMGFLPDVKEIIAQSPYKRQTMLFSATIPPAIRTLAGSFMRKPLEIQIQSKEKHITLDEIKQVAIETSEREKPDALCAMIDKYAPYLAIIFCRTKRRANSLNALLADRGYSSDELHGDLTQAKREHVMKKFRLAKIQLLVATDVAARGLDIEGVTHIFNYDIPHDADSYIHRIGRTGRAGQTGIAFTFVSPTDKPFLRLIEDGIHKRLDRTSAAGEPIVYKPAKRGDFHKENKDAYFKNKKTAYTGRAAVETGRKKYGPAGGSSADSTGQAGAAYGARGQGTSVRQGASAPAGRSTYGQDHSASGADRKSMPRGRKVSGEGRESAPGNRDEGAGEDSKPVVRGRGYSGGNGRPGAAGRIFSGEGRKAGTGGRSPLGEGGPSRKSNSPGSDRRKPSLSQERTASVSTAGFAQAAARGGSGKGRPMKSESAGFGPGRGPSTGFGKTSGRKTAGSGGPGGPGGKSQSARPKRDAKPKPPRGANASGTSRGKPSASRKR